MGLNGWSNEPEYDLRWLVIGLIAALVWAISSKPSEANTLQAYNFAPEITELHIIKNDGMNSHEVYTCRNVRTCYDLYKRKLLVDKSINCASKMYIQRSNGNTMRLKGVGR